MSEQETIADIIAEKRREANYIVQVAQGKCHTRRDKAEDEARDIRREADRLEAAHKRELDKLRKQVSNAAKLREALIDVVKRLEAYIGCDHHTFHPTATTCDGITSVGKCVKIGTCAAIFKARAALAATEKEGGNDGNE